MQAAAAGPTGFTSPKITPVLPPPAPPVTTPYISNCSGYITKDEIMAGLELASGQVYVPFDQWCAPSFRLLAYSSGSLLHAGILGLHGLLGPASVHDYSAWGGHGSHGNAFCDLPRSWDERLAAIQDYYGSPGAVMPFHFLNPGAYISNVTFWLKALDDYQHGNVRAYNVAALAGHATYAWVFSL